MSSVAGERWADVWASRTVERSKAPLLAQLLAADGFDTGHGNVEADDWTSWIHRLADELGIGPESAVYEVGCGAGAFLYPLHQLGCRVAGLDQSPALVEIAREAIPDGDFQLGGAVELPTSPRADVVLSFGVFFYFPSLEYASAVLSRMVAKATHAVAILDLPDQALRDEALVERIAVAGGPERYAERYAGLDHLHYSRPWVRDALAACGLERIQIVDQSVPGYANGQFRFNAWGFVPGRA